MNIGEIIENVEKRIDLKDCIKTEVEMFVYKLVGNEIEKKKEQIEDFEENKEHMIQEGSELILKYLQTEMCNGCDFLGCHECRRLWWL